MNDVTNILIVGVGGQGTLLASKIIGEAATAAGFDVKQSEVHGMAQRGGSVVTHVRFGPKVYTPLVEKGQADIIIAFEKLEALRWADYLKSGGFLIINDIEIPPVPVIIGAATYPDSIYERLEKEGFQLLPIHAAEIAAEVGEPRTVNVVLLGIAAKLLKFKRETWEGAIKASVPPKALPVNTAAFAKGWNMREA